MAEDLSGPLAYFNDPSFQQYLGQFQLPDEERKRIILSNLLLGMGAGIGGARRGNEIGGLSTGALIGGQQARATLDDAMKTRTMQLGQATQAYNLAKQQAFSDQMGRLLNQGVGTTAGGDQPFQTQGDYASQFSAAASGQPSPARTLPTRVPDQRAQNNLRDQLSNLNLQSIAGGGKDYSAAIKTKFPDPISLREGGGIWDPGTQRYIPLPKPPEGFSYDPNTNSFVPVSNSSAAIAQSRAVPKAVDLAYTPQEGITPGGGTGVVGNKLDTLFGGGPLPFITDMRGGAQAVPQSAPAPSPRGPVQTKLSPEQETRSKAYGEDAQSYRTAADQSLKALSELNLMQDSLKYFTPSPTLPARAKVAGVAQEIPFIGGTVADAFVPNSKQALPAISALEKLSVGLTAEQSKVFGSREGQQVIGMIKSATANAGMVPGAPDQLIAAQSGMHKWIVDKAHASEEWMADPAHNGSLAGFSDAWDKAHPISSYVPNLDVIAKLSGGGAPKEAPKSVGEVRVNPAYANNKTVQVILKSNPTPQQLQKLRDKGIID